MWRESEHDARGFAKHGHTIAIDCDNTLLRSEHEGLELVGIGLQNIVAVAMPDAVLVMDSSRSQHVKLAIKELKALSTKLPLTRKEPFGSVHVLKALTNATHNAAHNASLHAVLKTVALRKRTNA